MRKIYTVGGRDPYYSEWMQGKEVDNMEDADLVLFTGGEDVTPMLYGEIAHPTNGYNQFRDDREVPEYKKAIKLGKHIIGICRGSQLSCVMAGGKLVQHQQNPLVYHKMTTSEGRNILVSSTHHQAQYPWKMDKSKYKILGWTVGISKYHFSGENKEIVDGVVENGKEVEIAYYPKIKALGIQSHPEMLYRSRGASKLFVESIDYCQDLLNKHMKDML